MIEFCTKRRMVVSIMVLGVLTVFILILEETLTTDLVTHNGQNATRLSSSSPSSSLSHHSISASPSAGHLAENYSKKFCWQTEDFTIVVPCSKCSPFEINSKIHDICEMTGLKETIECSVSGRVQRSCTQITTDEKRRFWIFQSLMLLFTVLGTSFIKFRRSQLEPKVNLQDDLEESDLAALNDDIKDLMVDC